MKYPIRLFGALYLGSDSITRKLNERYSSLKTIGCSDANSQKKWLEETHPSEATCFTDEKKFNLDGPDSWATWLDNSSGIRRNKRQLGGGAVMIRGRILVR